MYPRLKTVLFVSLAAIAASGLLLCSGCKGTGADLGKDVLATVDGQPITVEDFKSVYAGDIPEDLAEKKTALLRMIDNKLSAKAATREGFMNTPEVMEAINSYYVERLPNLLTDRILEETKVTEEELKEVRSKQGVKPVIGVSLLLAPTLEDAERAMAELKSGADFKKTAAKQQTVKPEPDLEFSLDESLYPAGVKAVLNHMKPGELSPIMKLEVGYAIFRLNYKKVPEQVWKDKEAAVREELKNAKAKAEIARLIDKLRSEAVIKLDTMKLPNGEVQYTGAEVNGVVITMDPRLFNPSADPHFAHQALNPKTLRDALNKRINNVLLAQEAKRRGLDKDPAFKSGLALRMDQVLADAMLRKVQGTYVPTAQDIKDYYDKNKQKFTAKTKVRISRILLPTKEQAEAALAELKAGKDFAAVAKARSTDASTRNNGGDVGFVVYDVLKEPMKSAIAKLKAGEMSGIVKSEYGFEILKATARVEGGPPAMSAITTTIKKRVTLNKISERVEEYYSKLAAKASIKINEKLLAEVK